MEIESFGSEDTPIPFATHKASLYVFADKMDSSNYTYTNVRICNNCLDCQHVTHALTFAQSSETKLPPHAHANSVINTGIVRRICMYVYNTTSINTRSRINYYGAIIIQGLYKKIIFSSPNNRRRRTTLVAARQRDNSRGLFLSFYRWRRDKLLTNYFCPDAARCFSSPSLPCPTWW